MQILNVTLEVLLPESYSTADFMAQTSAWKTDMFTSRQILFSYIFIFCYIQQMLNELVQLFYLIFFNPLVQILIFESIFSFIQWKFSCLLGCLYMLFICSSIKGEQLVLQRQRSTIIWSMNERNMHSAVSSFRVNKAQKQFYK